MKLDEFLRFWIISARVKLMCSNTLLKYLHVTMGFDYIPMDYRTLLRTPTVTRVIRVDPGIYVPFGLKTTLEARENEFKKVHGNDITLDINVDGVSVSIAV